MDFESLIQTILSLPADKQKALHDLLGIKLDEDVYSVEVDEARELRFRDGSTTSATSTTTIVTLNGGSGGLTV